MSAVPVDPFASKLAYDQVADDLTRRIMSGEFTERIPSERFLADEYETSSKTVRKAVEILRERGIVRTAGTRGTFVVQKQP
jgi:DNA-binding GntR family transcriptional regulator